MASRSRARSTRREFSAALNSGVTGWLARGLASVLVDMLCLLILAASRADGSRNKEAKSEPAMDPSNFSAGGSSWA